VSESETERRETPTSEQNTTAHSNLKWLSGFVSLVGAWVFASAFVYPELSLANYWNNIIIGLGIFLIAGYNYYRMTNGHTVSVGSSAFVALMGLWMILVPFVLTGVGTAFWSDVVSGAIVAVGAGYNAYAGSSTEAGTATGA